MNLNRRTVATRLCLSCLISVMMVISASWIGALIDKSQQSRGLDGREWQSIKNVVLEKNFGVATVRKSWLFSECAVGDHSLTGRSDSATREQWLEAGVPLWARTPYRPVSAPQKAVSRIVTISYGWPVRSFVAWDAGPLSSSSRLQISHQYSLPIVPYFPGLIANLFFWCLLAYCAIAFAMFLNGRFRGADKCPKCKYDLHGLGPNSLICPECGSSRSK